VLFIEILLLTLLFTVFVFLTELYNKRQSAIMNLGGSFFIYSYILLCFGSLLACREFADGQFNLSYHEASYIIFTLVICVWACDTFAYLGGTLFGKHRLMPRVSPKKSIEGAVIGFIFSIIASWFAQYFFSSEMDIHFLLLIGFVAGIFGQYGDLAESLLKRDAGVKDSGSSIPGHGGMLDRIDSILFLSPLILVLLYLYPKYFQ
jgi:phosphatidate cytidylyltransferase